MSTKTPHVQWKYKGNAVSLDVLLDKFLDRREKDDNRKDELYGQAVEIANQRNTAISRGKRPPALLDWFVLFLAMEKELNS